MKHPNVFQYTDYRRFLLDLYALQKKANKNFSHRYIALKVGFKSSGLFTQILQGKTNISDGLLRNFVNFLQMNEKEGRYFELMVKFNQARSSAEKKALLTSLIAQNPLRLHMVDVAHYEYYSRWYCSAVRALIGISPFDGDYAELSRMVTPAITPAQAKQAVTLLLRCGLIRRGANGRCTVTQACITSGDQVRNVAIVNHQREMMVLASEAFDRFKGPERSMSTLTLGVSEDTYRLIEEKIRDLRQELTEMARSERHARRVYQINMQIFPLSKAVRS